RELCGAGEVSADGYGQSLRVVDGVWECSGRAGDGCVERNGHCGQRSGAEPGDGQLSDDGGWGIERGDQCNDLEYERERGRPADSAGERGFCNYGEYLWSVAGFAD